MRVKVVKRFMDKHKRTVHEVGDEITISKERFEEIEAAGRYVEPLEDGEDVNTAQNERIVTVQEGPEQNENTKAEAEQSEIAYEEMTVAELRDYAKEHDINLTGARAKADIVGAIKAAEK